MVAAADTAPIAFPAHPVLVILAYVLIGIALLLGILHEITFALEVLRMLVARVKEHARKLVAAARDLWLELATWESPAPPPAALSGDRHDGGADEAPTDPCPT